jgi:protein-tyrosine phosphatase
MKPQIYQVELIGSGSLSVMAKPVSGEWIDDEFRGISELGINRIVSLLEIEESRDLGLNDEKQYSEKNDIEFVSYPIKDRGLPQSISKYLAFTKKLYHESAGGLHTVIHCRAGIGRTGIIAAGVLLHCGFEPLGALEHISTKRGVEVPDTQEQIDWVVKSYEELGKST